MNEAGNLSRLYKFKLFKNSNLSKKEVSKLSKVRYTLFDQFISRYGVSPEYKDILELKLRITKIKLNYLETGKAHFLTQADVLENELKALEASQTKEKTTFGSMFAKKQQNIGFYLPKQKITVTEFYDIK